MAKIDREAAGKLYLKVKEIFGEHKNAHDFSHIAGKMEQQVHWQIGNWNGFEGFANVRWEGDLLKVWVDLFPIDGDAHHDFHVEDTDYDKVARKFAAKMKQLSTKLGINS